MISTDTNPQKAVPKFLLMQYWKKNNKIKKGFR